jgi:hypothetical protein
MLSPTLTYAGYWLFSLTRRNRAYGKCIVVRSYPLRQGVGHHR